MKILLDTHILIWMATEPERLSTDLADKIVNPQNSIFLSIVISFCRVGTAHEFNDEVY